MRLLIALSFLLAAAGCASGAGPGPSSTPTSVATRYTEEQISANRFRVSFIGAPGSSSEDARDRALLRAAELTLEKGNEWFEVADQASGENKHSVEIVMGKGETLAGGAARQYDARDTVRELSAKVS